MLEMKWEKTAAFLYIHVSSWGPLDMVRFTVRMGSLIELPSLLSFFSSFLKREVSGTGVFMR